MLVSGDQIVGGVLADYVFQSDWMAVAKTSRNWAAFVHAVVYGLVFGAYGWLSEDYSVSVLGMLFVVGTHFAIDRWRLARFVCWAKNFLAPPSTKQVRVEAPSDVHVQMVSMRTVYRWWHPWELCKGTGYCMGTGDAERDKQPWMAVWLMIITDNVMHFICNGFAIKHCGALSQLVFGA